MPSLHRAYLPVALLLAGCASPDRNDLEAFVAQSDQQPRRIQPLPAARAPEAVPYQASELPDPFTAARTRPPAPRMVDGAAWTPPSVRETLEAYPLDALRMVGTMQRDGRRWALVRAPDQTVHRVTAGNRLGENFGTIVEVTDTALVLDEHVQDGTGSWAQRQTALSLLEEQRVN